MATVVSVKELLRYESAGGVLSQGTWHPDSMIGEDTAAKELLAVYKAYHEAQANLDLAIATAKAKEKRS